MNIKSIHTLSLILLLLGVLYISENTNLWQSTYILSDEKSNLESIKQEYTKLNTEIAQYNAIANISSNSEVIAMQNADFIYLDKDGALVKR